MLSTPIVHACARCGREQVRQNGPRGTGAGEPGAWTASARLSSLGDRRTHSATDLRAARNDLWEVSCAAAVPAYLPRYCGKHAGQTCHVGRWSGTLHARQKAGEATP